MNIALNFLDKKYSVEKNATEYNYEDSDNSVLLDCNISKDKEASVLKKMATWVQSPSNEIAENLFRGGYFIVHYQKKENKITVYRDATGIKTGYYTRQGSYLTVSTELHQLAHKTGVTHFNDEAIAMLLAVDFCFDGHTIYHGIEEVKMGGRLVFNNNDLETETYHKINLATQDNTLSFKENVIKLREETNAIHKSLASANNVVYLSGGIDSCVMLGALDDVVSKKDLHCISYKVKGTSKDETAYAASIANHIGVSLDIREIDPAKKRSISDFEETILTLNNPYIGYWIFSTTGDTKTTFFAGQDTRLHTPDINKIDNFVFDLYLKNITLPLHDTTESLVGYIHKKLNLKNSSVKALKHLDRVSKIGFPKSYIEKYILEFKHKMKGSAVEDEITKLQRYYQLPKAIHNKRQLYNEIIAIKWKEQYTDDIKYMQDIARQSSTYIAMPFYDKQFAEFCSSIPFNYVSKFENGTDTFSNTQVKVNKVVLREAFKDKLNKEVLYRKKAVSETNFLLFEGSLGENVYQVIKEDINSKKSFIKQYGLNDFINPYYNQNRKWTINDQGYLMKVYYISTLCVYFKNLKN